MVVAEPCVRSVLYSDFEESDTYVDEQMFIDEQFDNWQTLIYEAVNMKTNDLLLVADLGLWNGRKRGFKEVKNMEEAMTVGNEDMNEITIEDGELHKKAVHHDGTNHIVVREWKNDVTEEQKEKTKLEIWRDSLKADALIRKHTDPVGHYWEELYGL